MFENVLNKRDDENDFEYHKRLVYGKLKDKTLADYDYGEIAKYLYGKELASDETRKRMYGSCKTLEILDEVGISNLSEGDFLSELESKKIDLQKERQRFFDQRREFNKLVTSDSRREHLYESLVEAANRLPETVGRIFGDNNYQSANAYSDNEAVLVLSDWHYGMTTNNIWNEYNVDICKRRVQSVLDGAIKRIVFHNCQRIHVVLLGDEIHGGIHVSTRVAAEELVCDQLMQVSEIIAQFVLALADHTDEVIVHSTFGNHARVIQNKNDNIHMDNIERIIPWWLEQRIMSERANNNSANNVSISHNSDIYEFLIFNVCGYGFCASHGDLDKVKSSPRLLSTLLAKTYGIPLSYILLGDKHHSESFEELGVESILCGSLCGTDEYANNKRLYSNPSQLLLIVNPDYGVDARYRLSCEYE